MQAALDHFRALSHKLAAERVAYLAQSADLLEKINATAATVVAIENDDGDASKERATLRRLKRERAELQAPSLVDPLADVEAYAKSRPKAAPAEPVTIKVPNGQTPLAVHNNLTEKTNAVLAQIQRTAAVPVTDVDVAAQVDAIAAPARIVNGEIHFPRHVIDSNGMALTVTNAEGLLAWLNRDTLIAALEKAKPKGMTGGERAAALGDLYDKLVAALRAEAAAAMAAEQAGQRVIRRRHVHPAVLLGVQAPATVIYDWFSKKRGV